MRFYSYRDPRLDETLARFQGAANWIAAFSPTSEEMDDYVISTTAGFDTPLKPRQIIRREDADWFSGRTPAMRDETRAQIVGANMETVRSFAEPLRARWARTPSARLATAPYWSRRMRDWKP